MVKVSLVLLAAVAFGQQKLYVLNSNQDSMTVVDVASNRILRTVKVGKLPHGVAAPRSQERLYVATEGDSGLTIVDTRRDEVIKTYNVFGKRPNEIDVTSDGRFVYVPVYASGVYEVFDTREEKIVARIPTDGYPHNSAVSPDDRFMYLSPMDRGRRPAEDAARAGLPSSLNKKIYVVDARTHSVAATIPIGNTPRPIAISPDGKRLYVNTDELMGFAVLDLVARKKVSEAVYDLTADEKATQSRSHGIGATPDGREVWSTDINNGLVHVFDVTRDPPRQIAKLKTGRTPLWLTITPDGKTVYVANVADDTVSAFDAAMKTEKARIQFPKGTGPKRMLVVNVPGAAPTSSYYYPGRGPDWERRKPEELGLDPGRLAEAVAFAQSREATTPRDQEQSLRLSHAREPYDDIVGPTKERGGQNGIILRNGYIVAEWGESERVDMTYSVTKSYITTVAGLAVDRGLIRDVHDRVQGYVQDGGFDSPHNSKITWHMLLNQTSQWEGTLWGKPDWADRWNGKMRVLAEPGTAWQYNDVRVNRLALALLEVWRRPLPQVLKQYVMDPIGASPTWRWHGYKNSWVTIDGVEMQSVSGGGHWGGGMWISSRDHARLGYLYLRLGRWKGRQLISEAWVRRITTPTPQQPTYGYMNFHPNTDRKLYPSAPASSVFCLGNGRNAIWMDPEHDLVVVLRWIQDDAVDGVAQRVLAAVRN